MIRRNVLPRAAIAVALACVATPALAADGMITLKSAHDTRTTIDRLEASARDKGLKVFARIDHAAGAASIGQTLRPTELLIFGNPQGGTPFMACAQSVGIDLPLKALAWQDAQGQVWLGVNDPAWVARRHGAADCPAAAAIGKALQGLAAAAVAP